VSLLFVIDALLYLFIFLFFGWFVSGITQKVTGHLAEILQTLPNLQVIKFWWCCHLTNTTKKLTLH